MLTYPCLVSPDPFEPAEFAAQFQQFLASFGRLIPAQENELQERVRAHLGVDPSDLSSLTEQLDPSEHPNVQLAFNALSEARPWEVIGLPGDARNFGGFSLVTLIGGRFAGNIAATPVEYVNVPIAVDETLPCVLVGLHFAWLDDQPVVALLMFGAEHGPRQGLSLEVMAPSRELAASFITRVKTLMRERNVYRGKLLAYTFSEYGRVALSFVRLPQISRDDIVLAETDLDAIERHAIVITQRADALRAANRHLKRGLLLYGPPGTGKTYSVMYLCNQMPERTTVLLTGPAISALGRAVAIARDLQPSMIVLEDVDLVAMERTMPGMGNNPVLFQLLNEMDGLASDADIIFVLTTNRPELLEPALAARPGRIDQAVEIKLPDADGRHRLLELYLRGTTHEIEDLDAIAARLEGTSPAFIKELVRRAVLNATDASSATTPLIDRHLSDAVADLLEHSTPLARSILGATHDVEQSTRYP